MALPSYATPVQRTYYYAYLFFCCRSFLFLSCSFNSNHSNFIQCISISWYLLMKCSAWPPDPEAWSLRWYQNMIGNCSADVVSSTVPCSNKWMIGTVNSFFIGFIATFIATTLGTLSSSWI